MHLVGRPRAGAPTEDELVAGLLRAQALLHSLGITAWQDAIVGADAGLTATRRPPTCAAAGPGPAHRPGRRRAVVGPRPGRRADRRAARAPRAS